MKSKNLIVCTLLTIATITSSITSHSAVISGSVYNPANGHNYYLLSPSTWTAAESQAIGLGGHLATVNDLAENTWLLNTFSLYTGVRRDLWLGLSDAASEGNYVWANGEAFSFSHWTPDNPSNVPAQNYVFMYSGPDAGQPAHIPGWAAGFWDDYHDGANYFHTGGGLREIAGVVEVPEPSVAVLVFIAAAGLVSKSRRSK